MECDLRSLVFVEVGEFLTVGVGEEQEVGTNSLGDRHRAGDGTDAITEGGKEADFEAVNCLVEVLDLFGLGSLSVPLLGYCCVGFGVDFGGSEWLGHCCDCLSKIVLKFAT